MSIIQDSFQGRNNPAALLQQLIRFNTVNPPGNEAECISYIQRLLAEEGVQSQTFSRIPARPNLVARFPGQGHAPALLLQGHVDVVKTESQVWKYPPFEGVEAEGCIWGRGALDMKGGIAMMLAALLRAKAEGIAFPGDVILTMLCDEEAGSDNGALYLVEHHKGLFAGVRYAISEFGGFPLYIGGKKFYPIPVAEKQICWIKGVIRGSGGHGSFPFSNGCMAQLGQMLQQLNTHRLPMHVLPVVNQMINSIASALPGEAGQMFLQLLDPMLGERVLDKLGAQGLFFDAALHNTANVTIVRGGDKINVIPSEVIVEMDSRLLPGYQPADVLAELRQLLGDEIELTVTRFDSGPPEPDLGLYDTLADILRKADPDGIPIPFIIPGTTDARIFSRLGIQTYGFLPMSLPESFKFWQIVHAADERVPVEALEFGTQAIYNLLQLFGEATT